MYVCLYDVCIVTKTSQSDRYFRNYWIIWDSCQPFNFRVSIICVCERDRERETNELLIMYNYGMLKWMFYNLDTMIIG